MCGLVICSNCCTEKLVVEGSSNPKLVCDTCVKSPQGQKIIEAKAAVEAEAARAASTDDGPEVDQGGIDTIVKAVEELQLTKDSEGGEESHTMSNSSVKDEPVVKKTVNEMKSEKYGIVWEDSKQVQECRRCETVFPSFTLFGSGKHHCRVSTLSHSVPLCGWWVLTLLLRAVCAVVRAGDLHGVLQREAAGAGLRQQEAGVQRVPHL